MLCELCNTNEATIHMTKVVSGRVISLNLCEKCVKETKNIHINPDLSLKDLLKCVMKIAEEKDDIKKVSNKKVKSKQCKVCGTTYEDVLETGKVGCINCYKEFGKDIEIMLRRMYGSITYEGKEPKKLTKDSIIKAKIRTLKLRLKKAIEIEDYDEAAKLRDLIKKVENEK